MNICYRWNCGSTLGRIGLIAVVLCRVRWVSKHLKGLQILCLTVNQNNIFTILSQTRINGEKEETTADDLIIAPLTRTMRVQLHSCISALAWFQILGDVHDGGVVV